MIEALDVYVLDHRPSPAELLFMQEALDNHFKKQSIVERLRRYERLRVLGVTVTNIAKGTGYSQGDVSRILGLSRLGVEAREFLRQRFDIEKAFIASQCDDPAKQVELMKEAAGMTRDQMRRRARGAEIRAHRATFPLPTGFTVIVQGKQMSLKDVLDTLLTVVKELRQAQKQRLDITTAARVLRDQATANQKGNP